MAPTVCARCERTATQSCSGCKDAPTYRDGDHIDIFYCNSECQREHWPDHKAHCRSMKQRKKLLRGARILRAALLTYREVLYDTDLTGVEERDGKLLLYREPRSIRRQSLLSPFPNHITTKIEHREAALSVNQCMLSMALLSRLTRKLLRGVASSFEIVDIEIGKPVFEARLVPGPEIENCPHTILKVGRLFSNESWVIDTTGCQFGFRDVLVPFRTYMRNHKCRIVNEPSTYDACETKDLDFYRSIHFMTKTAAQRRGLDIERRARLHFAAFVDDHVGDTLLDGSEADFGNKFSEFLNQLKTHLVTRESRRKGRVSV